MGAAAKALMPRAAAAEPELCRFAHRRRLLIRPDQSHLTIRRQPTGADNQDDGEGDEPGQEPGS